MSETAVADGAPLAVILRAGLTGMLAVRAAHDAVLGSALGAVGLGLPPRRQIVGWEAGQVVWMSPDELLVLCAPDAVPDLTARLGAALGDAHHLITDMSEARAVFHVEGAGAAEVLAKLCPVDLLEGAFPAGEVRRTRLGQVPAAFWRDEAGFTLLCFRSVAVYVAEALRVAARPGTGVIGPV